MANDEQLQELLGVRRAEEVWSSGQALLPGVPKRALVFVHGQAGPMHHVVISLGGDTLDDTQVMSLYRIGTGGVFGMHTSPATLVKGAQTRCARATTRSADRRRQETAGDPSLDEADVRTPVLRGGPSAPRRSRAAK